MTSLVENPMKKIISVKEIKSTVPDIPLDYSFMTLTSVADILQEEPVSGKKADTAGATMEERQQHYKRPVSIRLSNNSISSLDDLEQSLAGVFYNPSMLQWLDLSANQITKITPTTFSSCPNVSTLHLHSNRLKRLSDIDNIASLKNLRSLTLHGNPVEEKKNYRNYIIHKIPSLIQLDFSCITKQDREKAHSWSLIFRKKLNGATDDDV